MHCEMNEVQAQQIIECFAPTPRPADTPTTQSLIDLFNEGRDSLREGQWGSIQDFVGELLVTEEYAHHCITRDMQVVEKLGGVPAGVTEALKQVLRKQYQRVLNRLKTTGLLPTTYQESENTDEA